MPISVKLSSFYSSMAGFAQLLAQDGADGLVLFNRLFTPDIDIENLELIPQLELSRSDELGLRLRWIGIISQRVKVSLAITGGVHTTIDAVKATMAGAHAIQLVSSLMHSGPAHITTLRDELAEWMEEHEYESLEQMRGCMNFLRCPRPERYARANYMKVLGSS